MMKPLMNSMMLGRDSEWNPKQIIFMKLALRLPNDIHEDFLDEPPAGVPRDEPKIKTIINMDTNLFNLIDLLLKQLYFRAVCTTNTRFG